MTDPVAFLKEVFGTSALFSTDGVEGQIKRTAVSSLSDAIAESKIPALDLAANYEELSQFAMNAISPKLASLGLGLTAFVIENISLPEEVEKTMDKRTSMGVLGDLNKYAQYQAAEAMRDAAQNPGGMAGAGMGMGAGMAMGQMMNQMMGGPNAQQPQAQSAPRGAFCPECGAQVTPGAKFCPGCGKAQSAGAPVCVSCGKPLTPGAKFCPHCGAKQG